MHQDSMQCNSMKKVSLDREHQKSIILSSIVCYRIAVTALLPLLFFFLVEDLPIRLLHPAQLDVCTDAVILQYLVKLRNTNTLFYSLIDGNVFFLAICSCKGRSFTNAYKIQILSAFLCFCTLSNKQIVPTKTADTMFCVSNLSVVTTTLFCCIFKGVLQRVVLQRKSTTNSIQFSSFVLMWQ